jgi:hypothetical protein
VIARRAPIRSLLVAGVLIGVVAACQASVVPPAIPNPSAPASAAIPSQPASVAPTPTPAPSFNRPDPGADAPPIADPYWLGVGGATALEIKDAAGQVIRTDHGKGYQVFLGGGLEGGIVVNGRDVGSLEWIVSVGPYANELETDPMQEQLDHMSDNMTLTPKHQGGSDVTLVESPLADLDYHAAYWRTPDRSRWFTATAATQADLIGIVTALLGP